MAKLDNAHLAVPNAVRFYSTHVQVGTRSFRLQARARALLQVLSDDCSDKNLTDSSALPREYLDYPQRLHQDLDQLANCGLIAVDGKTTPVRGRADPLALLIQWESKGILRCVTALSRLSICRALPAGPFATCLGLLLVAYLISGFDPVRFARSFAGLPPLSVLLLIPVFFLIALHHEAGHVAAAKRLSCPVGRAGIGVYLTSLVLFVDLTSLHKVEPRRRASVDLGGIANDVVLFAAATASWFLFCPDNFFLHDILTVAAVSCLFFELNPWARGDGAWFFKDLAPEGHSTSLWLTSPRSFLKHIVRPAGRPLSRSYQMQILIGCVWIMLFASWSIWMTSGVVAAAQSDTEYLVRLGLQLGTSIIGAAGLSRVAYEVLKRRTA